MDERFCRVLCYEDYNCVSYNFMIVSKPGKPGTHKCELSNATHEGNEGDLEENSNYTYQGARSACVKSRCENNGTCQTGLTNKGYRCLCSSGFTGQNCETALTCKELYRASLSNANRAYRIQVGSESFPVFCYLSNVGLGACGTGGWTLVMKIDGNKMTFHYDSNLWSNNETFNLAGGETGFDTQETKLPTYWSIPFSNICLGMKIGQEINFIAINRSASSLYSLIADGKYRVTSLGRDTWKTMIGSAASLQRHCNREGFNVKGVNSGMSKARIGIIGNNENNCHSPDSRIGLGTGGSPDEHITCGNEASYGPDNGDKTIKTMGYIFVQ